MKFFGKLLTVIFCLIFVSLFTTAYNATSCKNECSPHPYSYIACDGSCFYVDSSSKCNSCIDTQPVCDPKNGYCGFTACADNATQSGCSSKSTANACENAGCTVIYGIKCTGRDAPMYPCGGSGSTADAAKAACNSNCSGVKKKCADYAKKCVSYGMCICQSTYKAKCHAPDCLAEDPPDPPCTTEYRCQTPTKSKKWCDGWLPGSVNCDDSIGSWVCKTGVPDVKLRQLGEKCVTNANRCGTAGNEEKPCANACNNGQCIPHADFTVTKLSETATEVELQLDAANSTDPYGGTNLSYDWSYSTGGSNTGVSVTRSFPKNGNLQITLTVTTAGLTAETEAVDNGTTDSATYGGPTVVINADLLPLPGVPAMLNATGTTDDKDSPEQLVYDWDYEGDGVIDETFSSANSAAPQDEPGTHLYTTSGQTWVELTVTDTDGLFSTASVLVDVQNQAPIVDFDCAPTEGIVPLTVDCTNNSSDPDGHNITSEWNFEIGAIYGTENASHVYTDEGLKAVILTVTDEFGAYTTDSISINAKLNPAITILTVSNPGKVADPAFITFSCNKATNIKLSYYDNEDNSVLTSDAIACGKNPLTITKFFPESAVYKIVGVITNGLNGPVDSDCDNCPKTVYTVVGREVQELETPENSVVLVVGIAFAVLLVTGKR